MSTAPWILQAITFYGIVAVVFLIPVTAVAILASLVIRNRGKRMMITMLVTGAMALWLVGWGFNAFSSGEGWDTLTWFDRISAAFPFVLVAIADSALVVYAITRETDK